jgi:hypothetical protein
MCVWKWDHAMAVQKRGEFMGFGWVFSEKLIALTKDPWISHDTIWD